MQPSDSPDRKYIYLFLIPDITVTTEGDLVASTCICRTGKMFIELYMAEKRKNITTGFMITLFCVCT